VIGFLAILGSKIISEYDAYPSMFAYIYLFSTKVSIISTFVSLTLEPAANSKAFLTSGF